MDYLSRKSSPISLQMWAQIDQAVIESAKKHLVCRRFLNLFGPLGSGTAYVNVDTTAREEESAKGFIHNAGRTIVELPQLYEDFTLFWRDVENSESNHLPPDLSAASAAAQKAAKREDNLILFGNNATGQEGLFTAKDSFQIKKGIWKEGENAFRDIAHGIAHLSSENLLGRYALILSPDIYLDLQRILPGINIPEVERISKLVNGRLYATGAFGAGKAVLVCAEPQYMDLAIGCDMSVGYLETKNFNHEFRIMETVALRIKDPNAIVRFE